MSEECSICGLDLDDKYTHRLKCNHVFHYECLVKTFMSQPNKFGKNTGNTCPYCRVKVDYMPVVNGLKKMTVGVHCQRIQDVHVLENTPCKFTLKRGKNKGNTCSSRRWRVGERGNQEEWVKIEKVS